jgi:hypothetical protein
MTENVVKQAMWLADALTDLDILFSTTDVPELAAMLVTLAEKNEKKHDSESLKIVSCPEPCSECGSTEYVCKREADELTNDLRDKIDELKEELEARTSAYNRIRMKLERVRAVVTFSAPTRGRGDCPWSE